MRVTLARPRPSERGFSLVELSVVLLIIAIVMGVAFISVRGARNSGYKAEVSASAIRFSDAVERFQQEHGRKLPVIGTTDWPVAKKGPVHRLQIGSSPAVVRRYMKQTPEMLDRAMPGGATIVQATAGCPAAPSIGGLLVYRRGPAGAGACGPALSSSNQFSVRAYWNGQVVCESGDVPVDRRC